jgi:GNAT superfamily N-acetyltransferase
MSVEYRKMRLEDEDAVFGLRMSMWGAPSIEYVRQGAHLDPQYLDHTFVAVSADGGLLSTIRYWLREIRDTSGTPQRVGCVASVATVESARREGHARRLMQLGIDAMRDEGCAWSFLLSSDMGVPLYESLGYRSYSAPFYHGMLSGARPPRSYEYEVRCIQPPFDFDGSNWHAVREIYTRYNAHRSLSLVRDEDYWRGYFARRISSRLMSRDLVLFLAHSPQGQSVGYMVADYSLPGKAREDSGLDVDQFIYISEFGNLAGHEDALPTLLSAMLDRTALPHSAAMAVRAPREGHVDETLRGLFSPGMQLRDCAMMALPLRDGFGEEDVAAIFAAPGALFWTADDF